MCKARWLLVPLIVMALAALTGASQGAVSSTTVPRSTQLTATPRGTPPPPPDPGGINAGDPDDIIEGNRATTSPSGVSGPGGGNLIAVPVAGSLWVRLGNVVLLLRAVLP
jgi:hypothetical protein